MKNVLEIVVDSLSYKVLQEYPFPDELFISKISKQSIVFKNMYTQGPFTEASLNQIIAGQKGIENGAYMYYLYP